MNTFTLQKLLTRARSFFLLIAYSIAHYQFLVFSLQHPILASSLSSSIVEVLGKSQHWARRQTYAVLCGEIVKMAEDIKAAAEDNKGVASYSAANFSTELLPHLLDLTWDKVSIQVPAAQAVVIHICLIMLIRRSLT